MSGKKSDWKFSSVGSVIWPIIKKKIQLLCGELTLVGKGVKKKDEDNGSSDQGIQPRR